MKEQHTEQQLLSIKTEGNEKNKRRIKWICIIVAIAVVVTCIIVFMVNEKTQESVQNSREFSQGISVLGCDLSGLTMEQGRQMVQSEAQRLSKEHTVTYLLDEQEHQINGEEAKMQIEYLPVLQDAFAYGKNGSGTVDENGIKKIADMPMLVTVDETAIGEVVAQIIPSEETGATKVSYEVEKTADEEARITEYNVKTPDVKTNVVDIEKLVADIKGQFETQKQGPVNVAKTEKSQQGADLEVLGTYETKINRPELDSAYNIWKASDELNATEIKSGESFDMKGVIGEMVEEDGWKNAIESVDGQLQNVVGGGLNHLASTVFAAALSASLEIEENEHLKSPPSYIEEGLDADVYSEGANLKIKNNRDSSIFIVIQCNATQGTLTVSFLGLKNEDEKTAVPISEVETQANENGGVTAKVSLEKRDEADNVIDTQELFSVEYEAAS